MGFLFLGRLSSQASTEKERVWANYEQLLGVVFSFFQGKKKKKNVDPENIIGHNFFLMYWPGCPNSPETEIPYHQKPLNAELGI